MKKGGREKSILLFPVMVDTRWRSSSRTSPIFVCVSHAGDGVWEKVLQIFRSLDSSDQQLGISYLNASFLFPPESHSHTGPVSCPFL